MKIDIFTKQACPHCKFLKNWLIKKGVSYNEKPIELEQNKTEFLRLQGNGFPFTTINEGNEVKTYLGNSPVLKKYLKENQLLNS